MQYNIQFEDNDTLTIEDENRTAPIAKGDQLILKSKLYEVAEIFHNFDDGKCWLLLVDLNATLAPSG